MDPARRHRRRAGARRCRALVPGVIGEEDALGLHHLRLLRGRLPDRARAPAAGFFRLRQQRVMMEGAFPNELKRGLRRLRGAGQPRGGFPRIRGATGRKAAGRPSAGRTPPTPATSTTSSMWARPNRSIRAAKKNRHRIRARAAGRRREVRHPGSARGVSTGECVRRAGNEMLFQQLAGGRSSPRSGSSASAAS